MTNKTTAYNTQEEQFLRDNYDKLSRRELCEALNRNSISIKKKLLKLGLSLDKPVPDKNKPVSEYERIVVENYGKIPTKEISLLTGKKEHAIIEFARRRGLYLIKDDSNKTVNTKSKATLAPLLADTPEAYYWMGYLTADGYMHHDLGQIVLMSSGIDYEHLCEYAKFLQATTKTYYKRKGYYDQKLEVPSKQIRVSVANYVNAKKIAEKFDWKFQKTYNPPAIELLNKTLEREDLFIAFFIGFCDGDGYISKKDFNLKLENHVSWKDFLEFCYQKLESFGYSLNSTPKINKRGYAQVILPKSATLKLKQFIIDSQLPYLKRKWDKIVLN